MAKQIICDNLAALILPDRYVHGTPISAQAEPPKEKRQKWLRDIQIIPDVLIEYESEPIAVEVYVAHRDPAKAAKYEQAGMAAFEINLSLHRHLLLGGSEFRNLVLRGAQSYWLNPPRIVREQRSEAARLAAEEQERQRILAAERSARELEWQREQNRLEAERLRQANERRAKLRLEQQEQQRLLDEQRHEADRLREQQKLDSETTFQRLGRGLSDREKEMLLAKARRRPYSGSENPWQFLFGYKVG